MEPDIHDAVVDFIRDWAEKTTLLNGQPVEVATEIEVTFTLD